MRYTVLADGLGVPLRYPHYRLPKRALPSVALKPEVDRIGDLSVDLTCPVVRPNPEHEARRREVMDLSSDFLTVLSANREPLVIHEVAKAVTHWHVERLLERARADYVVVNMSERDASSRTARHVHL